MDFYKLRHIHGFQGTRDDDSCYDPQFRLDAVLLLKNRGLTRFIVGPFGGSSCD